MVNIKGRDLLSISDLNAGELIRVLDAADEFKMSLREQKNKPGLAG